MSVNPSTNWFWNDWDNDRELQLCSFAAQGLWMRMLSIAARSGGYVRVGGVPCSTGDIAMIVGHRVDEVAPLIAELEARKVFSRTRAGCIYNRRQVRDAKTTAKRRANGRLGGNPALIVNSGKQTQKPPVDNQTDNPEVNSRARAPSLSPLVPEGSKEERTDANASVARDPQPEIIPPEGSKATDPHGHPAEQMIEVWIQLCGHIHKPTTPLAPDRRKNLALRWGDSFERDIGQWRMYCARVAAAPWLSGQSSSKWHADIDWVLKPINLRKIMEGKYDEKPGIIDDRGNSHTQGGRQTPTSIVAIWDRVILD